MKIRRKHRMKSEVVEGDRRRVVAASATLEGRIPLIASTARPRTCFREVFQSRVTTWLDANNTVNTHTNILEENICHQDSAARRATRAKDATGEKAVRAAGKVGIPLMPRRSGAEGLVSSTESGFTLSNTIRTHDTRSPTNMGPDNTGNERTI